MLLIVTAALFEIWFRNLCYCKVLTVAAVWFEILFQSQQSIGLSNIVGFEQENE